MAMSTSRGRSSPRRPTRGAITKGEVEASASSTMDRWAAAPPTQTSMMVRVRRVSAGIQWSQVARMSLWLGCSFGAICQCMNLISLSYSSTLLNDSFSHEDPFHRILVESNNPSSTAAVEDSTPVTETAVGRAPAKETAKRQIRPTAPTALERNAKRKHIMLSKGKTTERERQQIQSPLYFFDSSANNDVNPALKRIHLLGERNSGTNFLNKALLEAFPTYAKGEQKFQSDVPILDYKHMFLHELLNETQLLQLDKASRDRVFVLMVRSPCDWAVSMKKKPWHLCRLDGTFCDSKGINVGSFVNDTLAEFWQTPLIDYGEIFLAEKHSDVVNATYDSVLQIRSHKLHLMQQVREVAANTRVVHFRDFEASPHRVIVELKEEFGLKVSTRYKELPPSKPLHRRPCLNEKDHAVLMEMIDWGIEAQFGFFPSDCHTCAAPLREKKMLATKSS